MEQAIVIIAVILVLGLVILIHEAGHLVFAKLAGTEVTDFALGFGPSLISRQWRGTRYHICALPLGGFVKITGMDPGDPLTGNSYQTRSPLQKLSILAGGSLGNLLLAVILIFVLAFIGFPRSAVLVQAVVPGGPAAEAGVAAGDIIREVDGVRISDYRSLTRLARQAVAEGRAVVLTVERRGSEYQFTIAPRSFTITQDGKQVPYNDGRTSLGVINSQAVMITPQVDLVFPNSEGAKAGIRPGDVIAAVGSENIQFGADVYYLVDPTGEGSAEPLAVTVVRGGERLTVTLPAGTTYRSLGLLFHSELERLPLRQTVVRALKTVYITTVTLISELPVLATREGAELVSGPLGIVSLIAQSARTGWYNLVMITMVITLNLALLNLFPIPALDGGHILFLFLGWVGVRISPRTEALAHRVGLALLLGLILLITFRDALGLWRMRG